MKVFVHKTIRRGLTLVEVLTAGAIVSILLALLIPGVMDSRRAAERIRCVAQLKQLGLANLAFHEVFQAFPAYHEGNAPVAGRARYNRHYSVFSHLLPQLDQAFLFNQINFESNLSDDLSTQGLHPGRTFQSPANTTAMRVAVPGLLCPADPAPSGGEVCSGSNYRANYGTQTSYGADRRQAGPFSLWTPVSARDVTDGLSHTAAFSEKPRGTLDRGSFDRFANALVEPPAADPPAQVQFEYCARQPIVPATYRTTLGINWLIGSLTQTCYNHMEVPNGPLPDCVRLGYSNYARATARSHHGPGANVALADGSVRFVGASVALATWKALGTRAGVEVDGAGSW